MHVVIHLAYIYVCFEFIINFFFLIHRNIYTDIRTIYVYNTICGGSSGGGMESVMIFLTSYLYFTYSYVASVYERSEVGFLVFFCLFGNSFR